MAETPAMFMRRTDGGRRESNETCGRPTRGPDVSALID